MLSYIIVGSGYRAEYFGRVTQIWPGLFRALYLCRSAEKADHMKRQTGVDAVLTRLNHVVLLDDFRHLMEDYLDELTRRGDLAIHAELAPKPTLDTVRTCGAVH